MVKKRARKRRQSDDEDSDTDFTPQNARPSAAPKKYSLRQRTRPIFNSDDFHYDIDGDEDLIGRSDDTEFEVNIEKRSRKQSPKQTDSEAAPKDSNGLIDFEDIIKADVVVNEKIDYDNAIQKNEIKLNPPLLEKTSIDKVNGKKLPCVLEPEVQMKEGANQSSNTPEDSRSSDDIPLAVISKKPEENGQTDESKPSEDREKLEDGVDDDVVIIEKQAPLIILDD